MSLASWTHSLCSSKRGLIVLEFSKFLLQFMIWDLKYANNCLYQRIFKSIPLFFTWPTSTKVYLEPSVCLVSSPLDSASNSTCFERHTGVDGVFCFLSFFFSNRKMSAEIKVYSILLISKTCPGFSCFPRFKRDLSKRTWKCSFQHGW